MDPTAGIKAAELLIAELQRARSRKDKARIASRLLTEELEQIDARILVAKNSQPTSLPDVDDLLVAAWDQQREAVADLFDTATWETLKDAVTLPAQVVRQLKEQQASGEVAAQILEALHLANVGARSNLVAYAWKGAFFGWLSIARTGQSILRAFLRRRFTALMEVSTEVHSLPRYFRDFGRVVSISAQGT